MRLRRLRSNGWPKRVTVPESGSVIPIIMRMLEVLPEPLGPRRPKMVPGSMLKERSATAILVS
jgi:hypothetical protein